MRANHVFEFGPFRLDARGRLLFRHGERVPLPPKAAEVLITLVEHRPDAVGREELLRGVWADTAVEEGSLTSHVSLLRRILGETRGGARYIETIPKRGYRFVAPVEEVGRRPGQPSAERVMLAVLPFENLSGEDQSYFSDGLTEETITHLGRLAPERLGVIARASVTRYKRTLKSIREIGEELGVSHVLEGSVRRSGRRARVTAQLIQVSDQTHVWAESYERDLGDLLALQADLARAIAREIEIKLTPLAPRNLQRAAVDPEAYEAYLKGRDLWNRRTLEAVRKSIRYFEASIEREPRYAAAHSGLADAYMTLHDDGRLSPKEARAKAKHAAEEALRIAPDLAEAHTSLAHVCFHELDWPTAEEEFRQAIELNRNYATARFYYANFLVAFGRFDEAIEEARAALVLDPVSLPAGANMASVYHHARRYGEAIEHCRRVLEIDPAFTRTLEDLGRNYEQQGKYPEAIIAFEKAAERSGRDPGPLSSLAHGYAVAGRRKEARRLLAELERMAKKRYVSAHAFAVVHAGLGDEDRAFEYLTKACDERSSTLPFLNVNPRLDSLRQEPRFQALLSRIGLVRKGSTNSGRRVRRR
jgi:TolB-like protein/Tfp pilus assembly protein PilF